MRGVRNIFILRDLKKKKKRQTKLENLFQLLCASETPAANTGIVQADEEGIT